MAGKIPRLERVIIRICDMANGWRFCPGEVDENGEAKRMDKFLYNDCRGW